MDSKVRTELELITERAARISEMAGVIWETEHEDDVVEMVGAIKPVRCALQREFDETIVVAVTRIFAPTVAAPDRSDRKRHARTLATIAAVQHEADREASKRRAAVSFPLQRPNARTAERCVPHAMSEGDPPLAALSRCDPDRNRP